MSKLFNIKLFHESTTKELKVIKDRVRNLIGSSNWGDEGRYKEVILRNMIKRFLPYNYRIGTGFIVKSEELGYNSNTISSTQIDIIIFDSRSPILFSEGDFYIITPNSVRAVIEVKTNIQNQDLTDILKKMNELGSFLEIIESNSTHPEDIKKKSPLFNGIFSFEGYENIDNENVERMLGSKLKTGIESINYVNHICLNEDIFIKSFGKRDQYRDYNFNIFSIYKIEKLSFSYFISNLLSFLTKKPYMDETNLWFPLDKEGNRLKDIQLYQL